MAGNTAQNKKTVIIVFLFRERLGGYGGKERVFDPFFLSITVL